MFQRILIANRGEVAVRVARACEELGVDCVVAATPDEIGSLRGVPAVALPGRGARAYLDVASVVATARAQACDAVHPGYGFLSESPAFAQACADSGVAFIGPRPDVLQRFGDKTAARELAAACGVPVPRGSAGAVTLEQAQAFFESLPRGAPMMVKAVAGGGGRGMRVVRDAAEVAPAFERCASEALAAFGQAALYVEQCVADARHIEVQVIGDGTGAVTHLGERECSVQRRHQKLVEMAPSPSLDDAQRLVVHGHAVRLAASVRYGGLGTFEFLLDPVTGGFVFIEANPRLQVEHTVTEEVYGLDLVAIQIRLAAGLSLAHQGLTQAQAPRRSGFGIQFRVNLERLGADGSVHPEGGTLAAYRPSAGPGVRVDGYARAGQTIPPGFDSLLAKVIVRSPHGGYADSLVTARRALREFEVGGPATNLPMLRAIVEDPEFQANNVSTQWLDRRMAVLVESAERLQASSPALPADVPHGASAAGAPPGTPADDLPEGAWEVVAPMSGVLVALQVDVGATVAAGQALAVVEAMKMEHVVSAAAGGRVVRLSADVGAVLRTGQALLVLHGSSDDAPVAAGEAVVDLDAIRADLAEVLAAQALTQDAARPDAVERRRRTGARTARANVEDLCDEGSFLEYGALALAAQRSRRSREDLQRMSPADGVITGVGTVNAAQFGAEDASCVVVAYDYTVFAGTQGMQGHDKQDRIFRLAAQLKRPLVLFAEGGGGRPGDVDAEIRMVAGLYVDTFHLFAQLSALVPMIGIVNGRCFAGNAALLGSCDVVIATRSSSIGMGGPAMIEGGGLGVVRADDVGPIGVQSANGVVDIVVADEPAAVRAAKRYLGYFQGRLSGWTCADQRLLRTLVPESRLRAYDMRAIINALADVDSVTELRADYAPGMLTALVRIEGRALGLLANHPHHLGGAIDAQGSDKAARFIQMCDAHGLPILSLCDTPGFMVGPHIEAQSMVRRCCRMFVTAANISVPYMTVVIRKGYGLGSMAMAGGSFRSPLFTVSWPSGEFGGMGLEGNVRLGFKQELEAIADPQQRDAEFRRRVAQLYAKGRAINAAAHLEFDNVIDPADTRRWVVRSLASQRPGPARSTKTRTHIDTW